MMFHNHITWYDDLLVVRKYMSSLCHMPMSRDCKFRVFRVRDFAEYREMS